MKKISEMNFKEIRSAKTYYNQKLSNMEQYLETVKKGINEAREFLSQLDNKEKQLTCEDKPILISDHSILRFLERVHEIDIEGIKDDIRRRCEVDIKLKGMIDGTYCIDGLRVIVQDRVIVTIYQDDKKIRLEEIKKEEKKRKKIAKRIDKVEEGNENG